MFEEIRRRKETKGKRGGRDGETEKQNPSNQIEKRDRSRDKTQRNVKIFDAYK